MSLCIFADSESVTIAPRDLKIKPQYIEVRKRNVPATVHRPCHERKRGPWGRPPPSPQLQPTELPLKAWSLRVTKEPFSPKRFKDDDQLKERHIAEDSENSGWEEFEQQSSGDVDDMEDEGIATALLSEHILSPRPKKGEIVVI